ncbi:hypothetical protein [Rhizobium sp. LC145]|uniref:hypothetical protein n=1 Tax=Rhizobium sp. LC145 TaxID=1120688 RepID=UPI00062A494D|nr:hypothetical protein [Rhizobium sp. LC145]KKX28258.1 hypothetical protein YH62_19430 [Rhizobium sp. LC145]TKT58321.1 hypothetical protein FDR95_11975 [Rhizobiaceae bacterium LC148]
MTNSVTHTRSYPTYIITQEPRQVPRRKGPFYGNKMVEDFLREAYRYNPEIICIVIDMEAEDNTWYPEHGYEWLDINGDGRKRHPRKDRPSSPSPQTNAAGNSVFPSKEEIHHLAKLALEEMQKEATTDPAAWIASYERIIVSYRRLALAKQQAADSASPPPQQHLQPTDDLRKRVMRAIFDPGATEGFKGDRDLTTWQTDAVMRALAVEGSAA